MLHNIFKAFCQISAERMFWMQLMVVVVGMGSPVGVDISSLSVTPEINGEISAMSAESVLAGIEKHSKPCDGPND